MVKPDSIALSDEVVRSLDWGHVAFNASATMTYEQPQVVELLLSPSLSGENLRKELQQRVGAQSRSVRISNRMEAQLEGNAFTIQEFTSKQQVVASEQTTRWAWEVIPTKDGPQTLHVTLWAVIRIAGSDSLYRVRTFNQDIQVQIPVANRVSRFIGNNPEWLTWLGASVVIPIVVYLWNRRKKPETRGKRRAA